MKSIMPFSLTHNSYGKSKVRLTKVVRHPKGTHDLFEIDAAIQLEGDFGAAYHSDDNRNVIATDTIKNTVYVIAKEHPFDAPEPFALMLAHHFLKTYPHVTKAIVHLEQDAWKRIAVEGKDHPHSFVSEGAHKHTTTVTATRDEVHLTGGISGLRVLKTTESAWANFHTDQYRTLKDTHDRILGTTIDATWTFTNLAADFSQARTAILAAMLEAFATKFSPSAQFTLRDMGEAALTACPVIREISITLPNQHRIPFNLTPFNHTFENDIYITTDEPHGLIKGTITRE